MLPFLLDKECEVTFCISASTHHLLFSTCRISLSFDGSCLCLQVSLKTQAKLLVYFKKLFAVKRPPGSTAEGKPQVYSTFDEV